MSYYDRANDVFMKAYGRYDITFDHGKGVYLYDINGKKYLDFYSGIGVNHLVMIISHILMLYAIKCIV